jgi:hypothetical protein
MVCRFLSSIQKMHSYQLPKDGSQQDENSGDEAQIITGCESLA